MLSLCYFGGYKGRFSLVWERATREFDAEDASFNEWCGLLPIGSGLLTDPTDSAWSYKVLKSVKILKIPLVANTDFPSGVVPINCCSNTVPPGFKTHLTTTEAAAPVNDVAFFQSAGVPMGGPPSTKMASASVPTTPTPYNQPCAPLPGSVVLEDGRVVCLQQPSLQTRVTSCICWPSSWDSCKLGRYLEVKVFDCFCSVTNLAFP